MKSKQSYINKLRRLAQREPSFIDIHAHLAYAFLEQNAPRKGRWTPLLKGLAAGNRLIPESFSGEIIWMHPENRPYLRALCNNSRKCAHSVIRMQLCSLIKYWHTILKIIRVPLVVGLQAVTNRWSWANLQCWKNMLMNFSPYWYELGLLHFLNGEHVKAATAFRHGFAANTSHRLGNAVRELPSISTCCAA